MNALLLSAIIGLIVGIIDIIPMIIQKLPRYSTISAFLFYFFITIIIFHADIPYLSWWLEGALISIAMMSPVLIHVGPTDKKLCQSLLSMQSY
ncbi:hypothetical protein [Dysgonomonas sp. Marseille-P4677]|uniref:hypothetical protein n=1 Tax=Dysgonomonas sp. Marseille-P4677 TaxID=2364790 RepID=UPI001F3D8A48|nr:hypothetical protein [Dysgonomonas sp. Marseille-P4677]